MKGRRPTKPPAALGHRPSTDARRRDSDGSFTSHLSSASRPSLAGAGGGGPSLDRSAQSAALKSVNLYLQSNSFPPLRPPLPSARDITAALQFLLARLDLPLAAGDRLEDELPSLLRSFGCPVALKPSVIRAPSTPHAWPAILAVLQWLVQIARYADFTAEVDSSLTDLLGYHLESYAHFARGDDDAAQAMDAEAVKLVEQQAEYAAEVLAAAEEEVAALEARAEALRSKQSRQLLEKERADLLEDVKKFGAVIESFAAQDKGAREVMEDKERVLEAKLKEAARVSQENVELRKTVEEQRFNVRDVERMKKELAAVERDIVEAEIGRSAFEEQILELDSTINGKMKELEALASECNQAIKRLKLGTEFQYQLNKDGTSPGEVLGGDYKTRLKPALASLGDEIKKTSMVKWEELISLQQQSQENAVKLEAKRKHLESLQADIDAAESRSALLKKELEDYLASCASEAVKLQEEVKKKSEYVESIEMEGDLMLKNNEQKLQSAVKRNQEETQACAREFLALVDIVLKYKEDMESMIAGAKTSLSETVELVGEIYRTSLSKESSDN